MKQYDVDIIGRTISKSKQVHDIRGRKLFRPLDYLECLMVGRTTLITHTLRDEVKDLSATDLARALLKAQATDYLLSTSKDQNDKKDSIGALIVKQDKTEEDIEKIEETLKYFSNAIFVYEFNHHDHDLSLLHLSRYHLLPDTLESNLSKLALDYENIYFYNEYKGKNGEVITGQDVLFDPDLSREVSKRTNILYEVGNTKDDSINSYGYYSRRGDYVSIGKILQKVYH